METPQKNDEREETNYSNNTDTDFYSPCNLFKQLVKACFKCLGHGDATTNNNIPSQQQPPNEPADASEMNITREFYVASLLRARARPSKPDLGTGSGGQTN
ncbi:hypothetical protein TIFTF001_050515 [Ficus carica]|uniref:Uncharacterized protein n=1 Tax=Ficus carica TaxID=3494 RepID=A0AA87Z8N0_FICCA|nr:hypothetical protein TIFTF001_050515 [Ficus carica]